MKTKVFLFLTFLTTVLAAHAKDGVEVSAASASKGIYIKDGVKIRL